jgi:hypothetical protein
MGKRDQKILDANQDAIANLWPEFESLIPDNLAALEFVLAKLFQHKMITCHCGNDSQESFVHRDLRVLICLKCSRKIRFMAATRFRYCKQLKAWLGAIFLKERRVLVTSYRLTRLCNIASATAHNIVTTLGLHIHQELEQNFAETCPTAPLNAFLDLLFKRSLISCSLKHPKEPPDEEEVEDFKAANGTTTKKKQRQQNFSSGPDSSEERNDESSVNDLAEDDKLILDLIGLTPISQDSLCELSGMAAARVSSALVILELSGLIQALPGNLFIRTKQSKSRACAKPFDPKVLSIAERAFSTIEAIYGGVSRKYLQLYLGAFWCHQDGVRWPEDSLLRILLRGEPIQIQEILGYISPLIVSLPPAD